MSPRRCRFPDKQPYPSRESAERALEGMSNRIPIGEDWSPYRCAGHWHLGHTPGSLAKRARQFRSGRRRNRRRKQW